ncbi:MAG: LptF/LptG family permease [Chitinophagaceae bacterium]|nr:LptF/LptG family permease [Chitinophagaceae bacterium]
MKKIDKYIISKYLSTFFFCLLLFTVIVVVVDISEKTDDFVKSNLNAWQIFKEYYLGFIPRFDAMLFPLFVFISVIFFTSKMAGRSEIIAILSSGVSFRRFMLPYIVSAMFLSLLLWLGYRSLVPKANEKFGNFNKNYVDVNKGMHNKNTSYLQNLYFRIDPVTYVGMRSYDTISKTGNGFFIDKFQNNKMVYNLRAGSIMWDTSSKKWKLSNVLERHIDSLKEKLVKNSNLLMKYNFRPLDLRKDEYLKDQMPTRELDDFIRREKMRQSEGLSDLLVERYNRDAIPVSVFILTIIGASLASRRLRGGSGAHLALGVVISVSYILFSRFSVVFAIKGNFSPFLAAWTPNILFGLLAFYIYKKAPK